MNENLKSVNSLYKPIYFFVYSIIYMTPSTNKNKNKINVDCLEIPRLFLFFSPKVHDTKIIEVSKVLLFIVPRFVVFNKIHLQLSIRTSYNKFSINIVDASFLSLK